MPKCRQKKLYGKFRRKVEEIFRELCKQRGLELLEGHLMPNHAHMCLKIPPKYSVTSGNVSGINDAAAVLLMTEEKADQLCSGVSIGHPIGYTGARQMVTVINQMKRKPYSTGLVSMCIGGGMGMAMIIER